VEGRRPPRVDDARGVDELKLKVIINNSPHEVVVEKAAGEYRVVVEGQAYKCIFKENGLYVNGELLPIKVEGALNDSADVTSGERKMKVRVEQVQEIEVVEASASSEGGAVQAKNLITAPMPGKVIAIKVKVGDKIGERHVVAVMEAMKMENEVLSESAGTVKEIKAKQGEMLEGGQTLVVLDG
jgi:biotin carboxyl carrier protein